MFYIGKPMGFGVPPILRNTQMDLLKYNLPESSKIIKVEVNILESS